MVQADADVGIDAVMMGYRPPVKRESNERRAFAVRQCRLPGTEGRFADRYASALGRASGYCEA